MDSDTFPFTRAKKTNEIQPKDSVIGYWISHNGLIQALMKEANKLQDTSSPNAWRLESVQQVKLLRQAFL